MQGKVGTGTLDFCLRHPGWKPNFMGPAVPIGVGWPTKMFTRPAGLVSCRRSAHPPHTFHFTHCTPLLNFAHPLRPARSCSLAFLFW